MSTPIETFDWPRRDAIPDTPRCARCDAALALRFGWCSGCRAAYCLPCGRSHFCRPGCPANGCLAGFCVRLVENGHLSETWGLPPE
ncbi:MAG: hypothetical protein AVDCRST_MAG73-2392 [uncultured Thermomicrobiales bacterium]|uniref:Uncharacterized protein n=1 Tax=uncultured Thermomicrobiales bacterium TaxID=1645740 RepID=A0A6J4UDW0_9BACT|nr:MAG: hypothetical protein AVDCRST_MAG73-2392 [uncultured Thermomicrobiales bacterium]